MYTASLSQGLLSRIEVAEGAQKIHSTCLSLVVNYKTLLFVF